MSRKTVSKDEYDVAIRDLTDALYITAKYMFPGTLPPSPGASWYDALVKYAPEKAQEFVDHAEHMKSLRKRLF